MKTITSNAKGLATALLGAIIAKYLHIPLPWLLGPLLAVLLLGSVGHPLVCHPCWRKTGQVIIGMALGLYFTPALMQAITFYWGFILLGIVWSLLLGTLLATLQYRLNRVGWATAWFSSAIGSASEMVNIAECYHAQVDKVVAAHSLRIVILVVLLPIFMSLYLEVDWHTTVMTVQYFDVGSTILIFLLALGIAKLFEHFNVLNAWILGPILIIGLLSYIGMLQHSLPNWLIAFGQLCIGWSLGSKFPFGFLKDSKRFLLLTILFNLLALMLSIIFVFGLIQWASVDEKVLLLGLSPGGIAEMSLMAKVLGLSVPIIVAFQLSRLIFVILTTKYFYQITHKMFF
ncbi:AbrB family transcriptional regulator [Acinetobacter sp. YH12239]|uniref:AbrB family transcriptional regulator n=1 Tax=Acinetobacter sp. YH12239 TaxID=2601166 RepID=UPI0015D0E055|nr:AbrB family transcriptional regulator [Acinetobacter sp. YH12239]